MEADVGGPATGNQGPWGRRDRRTIRGPGSHDWRKGGKYLPYTDKERHLILSAEAVSVSTM